MNKLAAGIVAAWTAGGMAMADDQKALPPPDPAIVEATTRFTVDLYRQLAAGTGNVFCSPLNVATAVEMTAAGAKGETAAQIERALHLDALGEAAHDGLGRLVEAVRGALKAEPKGDEKAVGLWTANAGWFDESEKILPGFIARLERAYHAKPHRVDFARSPDAAREAINLWVADQTRDRIRDLLKPDHVRPGTSFILTSAIYFRGLWQVPFRPEATTDEPFRSAGQNVPVKMMNQSSSSLRYFEDEAEQVVTLPYKDGTLAMTVVLPKQDDGLAAVEASLSSEKLTAWTTTARPTSVKLSLPRLRSTTEFELKDPLARLGIRDAFDPVRADFSGITGDREISISAVVHKAFVEVEEKGTEAAAATGVVGVRSSTIAPPKPVVFRADHPFLYLIRDQGSGAILFIGRLVRP